MARYRTARDKRGLPYARIELTRIYAVFWWGAIDRPGAHGPDVAVVCADTAREAVAAAYAFRTAAIQSIHDLAAEERPASEAEACALLLERPVWLPYQAWLALRDGAANTNKNAAAKRRRAEAAEQRALAWRAVRGLASSESGQEREEMAG